MAGIVIPSGPPAPATEGDPSIQPIGKVQSATLSTEPPPKQEKEAQQPERPQWLPEKFKSPEDLAKAYGELEKKLGAPKAPAEDPPATPPKDAQAQVEKAGFDFAELTKEYAEKGSLTPETLKALAAKGIPEATVQGYIEGQKALAEQRNVRLADSVGGKDALQAIFGWAQANLSEGQIKAANTALAGAEDQAALVLAGLKSQFETATGKDAAPVKGAGVPAVSGMEPFQSSQEVVKAMQDPRYRNDPAYRNKVIARLNVSATFGNHRG